MKDQVASFCRKGLRAVFVGGERVNENDVTSEFIVLSLEILPVHLNRAIRVLYTHLKELSFLSNHLFDYYKLHSVLHVLVRGRKIICGNVTIVDLNWRILDVPMIRLPTAVVTRRFPRCEIRRAPRD